METSLANETATCFFYGWGQGIEHGNDLLLKMIIQIICSCSQSGLSNLLNILSRRRGDQHYGNALESSEQTLIVGGIRVACRHTLVGELFV